MTRLAGREYGIREPLISLTPSDSCIRIFVIRGTPAYIVGHNEGIFRSIHTYDERYINVMSEARLKML